MPFEVVNQNEYLLVKLKGVCAGDENPSLEDVVKGEIGKTGLKKLVFQCSECSQITPSFTRAMAQIFKELKTDNGGMRLVAANDALIKVITQNGLDRILVNKMSLRGALVDLGLAKVRDIDANFINPFLHATQRVLKVQAFMESKPQKPYLKKPTDPLLLGDVSGIISITSEAFNGTLAISLTETVFCKIATKMIGEETTSITDQNVDLVGELANMILGQAKVELAALGYNPQMALPSCVWGKDHKIKTFGAGVCVVLPFDTEAGTFFSEIMATSNILSQVKAA